MVSSLLLVQSIEAGQSFRLLHSGVDYKTVGHEVGRIFHHGSPISLLTVLNLSRYKNTTIKAREVGTNPLAVGKLQRVKGGAVNDSTELKRPPGFPNLHP